MEEVLVRKSISAKVSGASGRAADFLFKNHNKIKVAIPTATLIGGMLLIPQSPLVAGGMIFFGGFSLYATINMRTR